MPRAPHHPPHAGSSLLAMVLLGLLLAPLPARAHDPPLQDMPRTARAVGAAGASVEDIVRAARADIAAREPDERSACLALTRWLDAIEMQDAPAVLRDNAAAILARTIAVQRAGADGFWTRFCLAALEEKAEDHDAAARDLRRALDVAMLRQAVDPLPEALVARTAGFLGHAQEAGGHLRVARDTFEGLRGDPAEGPHALVHLGRIAARTDDIASAVDLWLAHPAGLAAGAAVIAHQADVLWRDDAELSYRLVARALERFDRAAPRPLSADLTGARARLAARSRENAM